MGNCPPLPCPPPCPDVSLQEICANNNCHGCCIFHCNDSNPGVPPEEDFPPVHLRQLPHLPPPRPVSARNGATAAHGTGGVAQDDVPAAANGYRFQPSPWRAAASGSVATERASASGVAVAPPPGVPGNGGREVPSVSRLASWTGGGVRAPPLSRRTESGSAGTAWATSCPDDDASAAAPLAVTGNGDRPVPQLSRWPGPGSSGFDGMGFTWHDGSVVPRHGEGRAAPPPSRRTVSCLAETTWATGRDAGAAEALDMAGAVTMESGQDIGTQQGDSSPPAPQWRLPLASSSFSAGRVSPAESRRRFPQASGTEDTT